MARIGIVYFSGYGHTAKQAEAVAEGARGIAGAEVTVMAIDQDGGFADTDWEVLDRADAIVYGSPTYMGGPAWQFKKFADASSKRWFEEAWNDKLAGGFTNSATVNGDKFNTIIYFLTLAMQHGQIWVGTGLKSANAKASGPDDVNWTGGYSGAMAISPSDASPEEAPRKGDLETARLFGARIAGMVGRFAG